jgi:hypothetical protein
LREQHGEETNMNAMKMTREAGAAGPSGIDRRRLRDGRFAAEDLPGHLKIASVVLRATFIAALLIVAVRVSAPQRPGGTWLDMPVGDLARIAMGAAFCLCMARQLLRFPQDAGAYRTWLYLGLALAPLSLACVIASW